MASKRSRADSATTMALAGGDAASNVLSHLLAEHSHGRGLLGFFNAQDCASLRLVHPDFIEAVARFPVASLEPVRGDIGRWRACFPRARAINLTNHPALTDADVEGVRGVAEIFLDANPWLTGACLLRLGEAQWPHPLFGRLSGLRVLSLEGCFGLDGNFVARGLATNPNLEELDLGNARTSVGLAVSPMLRLLARTLRVLKLRGAQSFADADIAACANLIELDIAYTTNTSAAFAQASNLRILHCDRVFLETAAFAHTKLEALYANGCGLNDSSFEGAVSLRIVNIQNNNQVEGTFLSNLKELQYVNMRSCTNLTDYSLKALLEIERLEEVDVSYCDQLTPSALLNAPVGITIRCYACTLDFRAAACRLRC